jgi:hypothetical protein
MQIYCFGQRHQFKAGLLSPLVGTNSLTRRDPAEAPAVLSLAMHDPQRPNPTAATTACLNRSWFHPGNWRYHRYAVLSEELRMTRWEPWDWPDEPHRRPRIEVPPPELEVCIRVHVRDTAINAVAAWPASGSQPPSASPWPSCWHHHCKHTSWVIAPFNPTTALPTPAPDRRRAPPILWQLQNGTRVSAYDIHHRWLWIKETIGTKETMTGTGWARRWSLSCDRTLRWR